MAVQRAPGGADDPARDAALHLGQSAGKDNAARKNPLHRRACATEGTFTAVAGVGANATTFTDSGRSRGTYCYRVRAVNDTSGAVSDYSNIDSVRVP